MGHALSSLDSISFDTDNEVNTHDGPPPTIHYELVGECYVHGRMDGSAIDESHQGKFKAQMFDLR